MVGQHMNYYCILADVSMLHTPHFDWNLVALWQKCALVIWEDE